LPDYFFAVGNHIPYNVPIENALFYFQIDRRPGEKVRWGRRPGVTRRVLLLCGRLEVTMKFTVTIERDEDGVWVVECPAIPGCVSQGRTKEEALANIQEAIQLCLEVRAERGLPLTIETRQVEVTA